MQTQSYHIQSLLGQGGMAKVYLAEHKTLGHKVAIKVLNKEFVHNENIRKRFLAEARKLARMNHPYVVRVTDLIEEGEMVAFVMEYIDGQTLRDYLDQKGKLPNDEIKKLFGQMLEAVGYVHEQGLVHRDIKPSNFMLDIRGNIKLLDFGIAKTMDASSTEYTQTATSQHMGTPMYMSPEQVKSTKDVTAQSDIYSLGVVLWQMVTGWKPYNTNILSTFEVQTKIVNEPLPETHSNWDDIIRNATQKNLKHRFLRIYNGMLDEPKSQVIPKPQPNETEETVVQTNFSHKVEIKPSAPKRDKIFTETVKDPNEKRPFGLELWHIVILITIITLGLFLVYSFGPNNKKISQVGYEKLDSEKTLNPIKPVTLDATDIEYTFVDKEPIPPGGNIQDYFAKALTYPQEAINQEIEGKVFISFLVNSKGEVEDANILKGIGFGCDEVALKTVEDMPHWKPGENEGRPVNVRMNIPINFRLTR